MAASSKTSSKNSFDAFAQVDDLVSKPVLGSDGAASWQEFRKDHKSDRPSAAPKAPLKKLDKLGTGLTTWDAERSHEENVRKQAGQATVGAGYTNFKKKNAAEEATQRKKIKQIEARIRPDDKEYFIPVKTFEGWKFDYVFTTRPDRGTGYFWDGMDSIKKLRGELQDEVVEEEEDQNSDRRNKEAPLDDSKPKKKKRKKLAGPVIVEDPNNPMEQVAKLLQQRKQALAGAGDPSLPAGWEATLDATSGKTYYFCRATGERSWEKPTAPPTAANTTSDQKDKDGLPEGWQSAKDATTGKTYYYHSSGETRWETPEK
jgi:YHS domain-containing protein